MTYERHRLTKRATRTLGLAAALVTVSATTGCGSQPPPAAAAVQVSKVLTVVLENHGPQAVRDQMPFLTGLADTYGQTTGYRALTHPSLPNYLALVGGSTAGVTDDLGPDAHRVDGPSVFDVALQHGATAATYAEGMEMPCQLTSHDGYAVRHNPWTYFADPASRAACESHDRPVDALDADLSAGLPDVALVVPDLCHDGHDCDLGDADAWLQRTLGKVMSGPDYRAGRLALVVTFDEDEDGDGQENEVLTVVVAPELDHVTVGTSLDHLSWCRWMTDLVGAPPLGDAATATSLGAAFGV